MSFLICFVRQTQSAAIVYLISEVFCHEYLKKFSISACAPAAVRCVLDRNEVTKLKFEGKTFHIYANQREVRK